LHNVKVRIFWGNICTLLLQTAYRKGERGFKIKVRFKNHPLAHLDDKSVSFINADMVNIKSVPLQAWSGPEGSRKLGLPDFMTTARDGGKFVSTTHRPPLPPRNAPGTHFCYRLSRPQGHSAIRRIYANEKFQ